MVLFERPSGIIVACDFINLERLGSVIGHVDNIEGVVGYSIGPTYSADNSLNNVFRCMSSMTGKPILYNHQAAGSGSPAIMGDFVSMVSGVGFSGAVITPYAGPDASMKLISKLREKNVEPIVCGSDNVLDLTEGDSLDRGEDRIGYLHDNAPYLMFRDGAEFGADNFFLPAARPSEIPHFKAAVEDGIKRSGRKSDPSFIVFGIGRQGGSLEPALMALGDVKRKYALIGDAVYNAADIRKAAEEFCRKIATL